MPVYNSLTKAGKDSAISIIASLVMACPNLEALSGFYTTFDHGYDRLTHALTTRTQLKSKIWILEQIWNDYDEHGNSISNARTMFHDGSVANGDAFLNSHEKWKHLETLMLFGQDTGNLDYRGFAASFRILTSLKHLVIAGFDKKQFNDRTVAALPSNLVSLRLQDLAGITTKGLMRLTESLNSMRNLVIIGLEIGKAELIERLLRASPQLRRFSLVQSVSPSCQDLAIVPYYASETLQFLHWDVFLFSQPSIDHLASAIKRNAFPSLRLVRIPCDDGSIQRLCRPRSRIAYLTDSEAKSSLSLRTPLSAARLAAQERLEAARKLPYMRVTVTDEHGTVQHRYTIDSHFGDITSKITYSLEPDSPSALDRGGIFELDALLGPSSPALVQAFSSQSTRWCNRPIHAPSLHAIEQGKHTRRAAPALHTTAPAANTTNHFDTTAPATATVTTITTCPATDTTSHIPVLSTHAFDTQLFF